MASYPCSTCTAACCCGYFKLTITTGTVACTRYFSVCGSGGTPIYNFDRPRPPTFKQLALLKVRERQELTRRPALVTPRPSVALNTGMALRRMRASTGLARART